MPRLSLFRPEKGNDFKFLDKSISEMFQIGGADINLHKYIGTTNPTDAEATADQPQYASMSETNIQDLMFLENRDRKYDSSIYTLRGIYNVQDIDFSLSQFGLFIDQDTMMMTVHINDFVNAIGRKPLSGDVIEIPNLKDEYALNGFDIALPRYFVIDDVSRAAEGFSKTWYPHLYRLKLKKITDSQQFADILTKPANSDANYVGDYDPTKPYEIGEIIRYQSELYTVTAPTTGNVPPNALFYTAYDGQSLQAILSNSSINLAINDAILAQANADAPKSGYETQQFYTLAVDANGEPVLTNTGETTDNPTRAGYSGYLLGDGIPDNGTTFGHGINFPPGAIEGDFFLRTDFLPNRLFRNDGLRWIKHEDAVRHTLNNSNTRQTQKTSFINNTETDVIAGDTVPERQSLSKALKPKADF